MTRAVSKQLLPVQLQADDFLSSHNTKCWLVFAKSLIITTPNDALQFRNLLGNGNGWGIDIEYAVQPISMG